MKKLAINICERKAVLILNRQKGPRNASINDTIFEFVCNEAEKLMSEEQKKALYDIMIPLK